MENFIGIFITLLHILLVYVITAGIVLSNNLNVLLIFLIVLCLIIFQQYIFGRCPVTQFEHGKNLPNAPDLIEYTIAKGKLGNVITEKLITNIGMILVLNKIAFVYILEYYKNNTWVSYIKKIIKL